MSATALPQAAPDAATRRRILLGYAAGIATVLIWAAWMVGTRHAVTHRLPPEAVGLLRFGIPALLLAPAWIRIGPWPRGLKPLTALGLLGSGAPFFLIVATGMRFAPAAEIGPLLPGTMPLFVALVGFLAFGQRLGRWRILGFALIGLGILAIAGRGLLHPETGAWRGHLLLLTGALCWGLYTHAYRLSGLTPAQGAGLVALWSVPVLLPLGGPALLAAIDEGHGGAVLVQAVLQGVVAGALSMVLYGMAIDRLGASRAAALSPLGPVLGAVLAIPILGEIPDGPAIAGLVLASAGVLLASGIKPEQRA
ncbi:MAG TPA: DMT family transporter [Microvirga sp.]|jgi:drug/metabolite transporter (DMT)-like permease